MLYHGPVRVGSDAKVGKAILRVRIESGKGFESLETDMEVVLSK